MTEVNAIMLHLTDLFPEGGMGAPLDDPLRGPFLMWMAWYGNVLEPVVHFHFAQIESPALKRTFRDFPTAVARLEAQLAKGALAAWRALFGGRSDRGPDVPPLPAVPAQ
jgi:glutathione S-transferase